MSNVIPVVVSLTGNILVHLVLGSHFIIVGGAHLLSESPPPLTSAGSKYCVWSLIQRANRFLAHVRQEDNMPASLGLCCWKAPETIILEECEISGYGRFSALSNGKVRIVFNDRTCLHMVADFSARLGEHEEWAVKPGNVTVGSGDIYPYGARMLSDKTAGNCRLLLQNRQYQTVSVQQPGQFKRYVSVAQEWKDWVNSSPQNRETFYKERSDNSVQMSVERELQRIQFFNYIVDNTILKTNQSSTNVSKQTKAHSGHFQRIVNLVLVFFVILNNIGLGLLRASLDRYKSTLRPSSAHTTSSTLLQSFRAQNRCAPNGRPIPIGQASVTSESRPSCFDMNFSNFQVWKDLILFAKGS